MRIRLTSVSISNYDKALKFYTEVLGFVKKRDIPLGHGTLAVAVAAGSVAAERRPVARASGTRHNGWSCRRRGGWWLVL